MRWFLFLVCFAISSCAFIADVMDLKSLRERVALLEPLLLSGRYDEAINGFDEWPDYFKYEYFDDGTLERHFNRLINSMKKKDADLDVLTRILSKPKLYELLSNGDIDGRNCNRLCDRLSRRGIGKAVRIVFPFSDEFVDSLNLQNSTIVKKYNESNDLLTALRRERVDAREKADRDAYDKRESLKVARIKASRDAYDKKERLRVARIKANEKEIIEAERSRQAAENAKSAAWLKNVNGWVSKLGYKGYEDVGVPVLVARHLKDGGLEKYFNIVVGCSEKKMSYCDRWHSQLTLIQELDDALMYMLSECSDDECIDITVFTDKQQGKIYLEGQHFRKGFYVLKDVVKYETVLGATRTAPFFKYLASP